MYEQFVLGKQKFFIIKDYEELQVASFLYNPRKLSILIRPAELLIPLGERRFSPNVQLCNNCLEFLGHRFKYLGFDVPCHSTKIFLIEIQDLILKFHTECFRATEKLIAVRQ